jgi:hypothetical protein
MADDADMTQDRAEKEDAARAKVITYMAGHRELLPAGACHYCGEPVPGRRLFCDLACSKHHETEKQRLKATGR